MEQEESCSGNSQRGEMVGALIFVICAIALAFALVVLILNSTGLASPPGGNIVTLFVGFGGLFGVVMVPFALSLPGKRAEEQPCCGSES